VFSTLSLTVGVGAIVDFINNDCCNTHKINSDYPFSKNMDASATVNFTFAKAGKYMFWLDSIQWVYGTITVG
jgi:hypothetical protein